MATRIKEIKEAASKFKKSYIGWSRSQEELDEAIQEFKKVMSKAS